MPRRGRNESQRALGGKVTLRKAIESALPYVERSFPNQPLIEARLRLTLGVSFYLLGDPQRAAEQQRAALTLYSRLLGAQHPDTLAAGNRLANTYAMLGHLPEALKLHEETLCAPQCLPGPRPSRHAHEYA